MFGALRRVISGDDIDGTGGQQQNSEQEAFAFGNGGNNNDNQTMDSPMQHAVMVEHDHGDTTEYSDHDAPLDLIAAAQHDRNHSDTFTTSSSLSDASAHDGILPPSHITSHHHSGSDDMMNTDVYMEDVIVEGSPTPLAGVGSGPQSHPMPPSHYQQHLEHRQLLLAMGGGGLAARGTTAPLNYGDGHHHGRLQRMDSDSDGSDSGSARATTTSQNSSRDWGWFEDVHQSGALTPTQTSKGIRGPDSGGDGKRRPNKSNRPMHRMVVALDRDGTCSMNE